MEVGLPYSNSQNLLSNIVHQLRSQAIFTTILFFNARIMMMTKAKRNEVPEQAKMNIVYRSMQESTKEHVFSFTITPEQAQFVKAHRRGINFSQTFRNYLDSIVVTVSKQEQVKQ